MPRIVPLLIFLSFFMAILSVKGTSAYGQGIQDAYLVRDVQVDVLDQSAVKARNKAFGIAQDKAFAILAERFLGSAPAKPPSAHILSGMVQDFEIVSEQLSKKRYRGTYNFRFRPAAVRSYFGTGPVNFVPGNDESEKTILLLPYFMKDETVILWDKERNPFLAGLSVKNNDATSVILPVGDIADTNDIGEGDPHVLSSSSLKRLRARYDVADVVIAVAKVSTKKPHTLSVDMFRTDRGRIELADHAEYEETVPPQTGDQNVFIQAAMGMLGKLNGDWKHTGYIGSDNPKPSTPTDDMTTTMPPQAEPDIEPVPPSVPVTAFGRNESNFKVFITGMPQWLNMRKQLNGIPGMGNPMITSMKTNQVDMRISYSNWENLVAGLRERGFVVEPAGDGTYILKQRSGGY